MNPALLEQLSRISPEEREILNGRQSIDRSLYMDGSHDVISGEKLLKQNRLIAVRPHTRFIAFPEHSHDYVEMVYMCSGETRHRVNGNGIVLREGELLMLGQHARQSIEAAGEGDIAVNFIVRPAFFSGTLPFLGEEETPLRRFVISCLTGENEASFLLFHVADILPVQNLIENLIWTLHGNLANKRGINQLTMGLLFTQLLNYTDRVSLSSLEEEEIVSVLRYVEEHYRDGCLNELAAEHNRSAADLSRFIKRKTGRTYTELLQEKRLSQAAWFLRETDRRVEEIAFAVGYENFSYFHRIFREKYGQTPKHYRDGK